MNISLHNIVKRFESKLALDIDHLEISEGKVTGIIGPNGSGKSTLMKIISGLDKKYQGTMLIRGQTINQDILRNMTLVFQRPYLINTTVYNNIEYPLRLRGKSESEIKEKVESMIELLQLKDIVLQNARTLSGGEMQKVALARAIVFEPKLLLLDEPTSNIDPHTMQLMENAIKHANLSFGTTVVLVTHNIRQLQRLCSSVTYMYEGKVMEYGPVKSVLGRINEDFVGDFMEQEL